MSDQVEATQIDVAQRAVERGWLSQEQVDECRRESSHSGRPVGDLLVERGWISRARLDELSSGVPAPADLPEDVLRLKDQPDKRVNQYIVVGPLGMGGMGMVVKAFDLKLRRWAALKFVKGIGDDAADSSLVREAQVSARLAHPNIASIYEVSEHQGRPFVAMHFVDGQTLKDARKTMSLEQVVAVVRKTAEAVRYAHLNNVIHRDLKPANIMIDRLDQVYVMDFGLAKESSLEPGQSLGGSTAIVGTPNYMPPEQVKGKAGRQSDVYGIGAILYELTTGRPPFTGESVADVLLQVLQQDLVWPRKLNPRIPADLEAIIIRALEKDPKRRYATMDELIADLDAYATREPLRHARPPTVAYVLRTKIRRHPVVWLLSAALVLAVTGGTLFGIHGLVRARQEADRKAEVERDGRQATEAQRRRAEERLAYSFLQASHRAAERSDPAAAAVLAAESLMTLPSPLARARVLVALSQSATLRNILPLSHEYADFALASDGSALWSDVTGETLRSTLTDTGKPGTELKVAPEEGGWSGEFTLCADGSRMLRVTTAGGVQWWDTATGKQLGSIKASDGYLSPVARMDPRGSRLVLILRVEKTRTLARLWNLDDGTLIDRPLTHEQNPPLEEVAFSGDGRRFATLAEDHTVRIWSAEDGRPIGKLFRHLPDEPSQEQNPGIKEIALNGDGTVLMTSGDGFVRLWNAESGESVAHSLTHDGGIRAAVLAPSGKRVYTAGWDATVRAWNAASDKGYYRILRHEGVVEKMAITPNGRYVLCGSSDHRIQLWDEEEGSLTAILRLPGEAHEMAMSADGRIVAASQGGQVRVWDAQPAAFGKRTWEDAAQDGDVFEIVDLDFLSEPSTLAIASQSMAAVFNLETGQPIGKTIPIPEIITAFGVARESRRLVTGDGKGAVRFWNVDTGEMVGKPFVLGDHVEILALSPDERRLIASSLSCDTVALWDTSSGTLLHRETTKDLVVSGFVFTRDSTTLFTQEVGGLRRWDTATGKPLETLKAETFAAVLDSTQNRIATGGFRGQVQVLDVGAVRRSTEWVGHPRDINALAFSPDGKFLLTGSRDGTARLWDPQTGKAKGKPLRHPSTVQHVSFSTDGQWILTASSTGGTYLWDAATTELLWTVREPEGEYVKVVWSRDSRWLVLGVKKRVEIFDLRFLQDAAPPDLLRLRAQVATGLLVDEQGEIRALGADEWRKRKEEFQRTEPKSK